MKIKDPLLNWVQPVAFKEWGEKCSPPIEQGWLAHLSFYTHPDVVVAVGRLLFPKFIQHEGGVFLETNFSLDNYTKWKQELEEMACIEAIINHVHVYDLFTTSEKIEERSFEAVAELMVQTWKWALAICFPERNFLVRVTNSEQDYGPTLTFTQNLSRQCG